MQFGTADLEGNIAFDGLDFCIKVDFVLIFLFFEDGQIACKDNLIHFSIRKTVPQIAEGALVKIIVFLFWPKAIDVAFGLTVGATQQLFALV